MPERWVLTTWHSISPRAGVVEGEPLDLQKPIPFQKRGSQSSRASENQNCQQVALGKSHPCSTACLLIIQLQIWRRRVWHVLINVLLRASQARIREYGISIMNSLESKEEVRKRSKSDYPNEFLSRYLVTLYVVTLLESFFLLCMSSKGRKTQEVNSSSSKKKVSTQSPTVIFRHQARNKSLELSL